MFAWGDCRFRTACAENDIVLSESADGMHWSAPIRVAADPVTSTVDHFLPGLAVRPGTFGSSAELGVVYYDYPVANCTSSTCRLNASFSTSIDGGAHWTTSQLNSTAMQLWWLAPTTLGGSVGDYNSVSYVGGHTVTVFPLASAPVSGAYNEAENAATFPPAAGSPITALSGSGQTATTGSAFGTPLQASVVNPTTGAPVVGTSVTFTAPSTGASGTFAGGVTSASVTTNGSGLATAPAFTAGTTPGSFVVVASTSGGTTGYQMNNAGPPATITLGTTTSGQGAPIGTPFASPLTVTVRDANGTAVPGTQVTFTAPASGPSGTFAAPGAGPSATMTTNSAGTAIAPTFTANSSTGTYSMSVSAGTATGSLTLTNTSSAPASLIVTGGASQTTQVGSPFGSPLAVKVVDGAGQPYPGAAVTFTSPAAKTSATFVASGLTTTTVRSDATGTATVPNCLCLFGTGQFHGLGFIRGGQHVDTARQSRRPSGIRVAVVGIDQPEPVDRYDLRCTAESHGG